MSPFPRFMDGSMLVGMHKALSSWQHSQWVVMSYGVLLSSVLALGKSVSRRNVLLGLGLVVALVLLIPAKSAQVLSTYTMQFAHEAGKMLDMPANQPTIYNIASITMMWLPWLISDQFEPKEEKKETKRRKKPSKKQE
mmetsp:Transcript_28586/g.51824  ORF Transcript_28586/g.51824 Transcript_28586/m.51824 type:complete len:138 (-) Transcript_28586:80-493(-)